MRKFALFILFAVVAFATTVAPTFASAAQVDPGTIADVVTAATKAKTPEFTTLLSAIEAADPSVLKTLSDPKATLTVFAPTDAAFAALKKTLGDTKFNDVLKNKAELTSILLYHVLPSKVTSKDVLGMFDKNKAGFNVPTANGQYIHVTKDKDGAIFIEAGKLDLKMVDIAASNGVIHVVDAVLLPEQRTIATIVTDLASAKEKPEFTTLLTAVKAADPAVLKTLADDKLKLTVFAPTDAAFALLKKELGDKAFNDILANKAQLTDILLYHVLPKFVGSADLNTELAKAKADGVKVATELKGKDLTFTTDKEGNVLINGKIKVVTTDINAANGIIHVIDAVLVPAK